MSTVMMPQSLEELKSDIAKRKNLVELKEKLSLDISDKRDAFMEQVYKHAKNYENIEKITNILVDLVKQYEEVESRLRALDGMIVSKMEIILGDAVYSFTYPEYINDLGERVPSDKYIVVPQQDPNSQLKEVSANDLWFLRVMSDAIGKDRIKNFNVIKKQNYYKR